MGESNALYYSETRPIGAGGDFITAPEISQMFGEMVGICLTDAWQKMGAPAPVHYVELGPGRGTLAADALRVMARFGLRPQVHLVEGSPTLRAAQRQAIPHTIFHDDITTLPDNGALLVVANEFFDALPIHQLVKTSAGWRERMVGLEDEALCFAAGSKPMDAAIPAGHEDAPDEAILETSSASAAVMAEIAERLEGQGGAALIIDYGYERAEAAPRYGSTLQAVKGHEKIGPFDAPGEADLTALVDFTALAKVAADRGAHALGVMTQGDFLRGLGIEARAAALIKSSPERREEVETALSRLCSPEEMGELFKVLMVLGRGQ